MINDICIIIPVAGLGKRMKAYGPKASIRIDKEETVLSRQIKILRNFFPKSKIIVVCGFQKEKIFEIIDKDIVCVTLSSYIGPNKSGKTQSGKTEQIDLINALWSAIETDLIIADPSTAESLGRMVDLSTLAVTANRPADADKAAKFAGQVVTYFLNK